MSVACDSYIVERRRLGKDHWIYKVSQRDDLWHACQIGDLADFTDGLPIRRSCRKLHRRVARREDVEMHSVDHLAAGIVPESTRIECIVGIRPNDLTQ